jgi:hypothetical protein
MWCGRCGQIVSYLTVAMTVVVVAVSEGLLLTAKAQVVWRMLQAQSGISSVS